MHSSFQSILIVNKAKNIIFFEFLAVVAIKVGYFRNSTFYNVVRGGEGFPRALPE